MNIIDPVTVTDAVLTSSSVAEDDAPLWAAGITQAPGDRCIELSPTAPVTMSIGFPCVVTWAAHGRAANTPVVFTTTGALPAGIVAGVEYFVKPLTANTFSLARLANGSAINSLGTQSGTHTATARVHKIYESLTGARSDVTITIATAGSIGWPAHGSATGDRVSFVTTGALPTGLNAGVVYFVKTTTPDAFTVSLTAAGAAITTAGTQSGVHTATTTPAASFSKQPGPNKTIWNDIGATNARRMFDGVNSSQTEAFESIVVTLNPSGIANGAYVGNADADTVTWDVIDPVDGLVYSETQNTILSNSDSSFWNWHFKRIVRKKTVASLSLPMYAGAAITVTLSKPGGIAKCGTCIVGQATDLGPSLYGLGTEIKDYSTTTFTVDGSSSSVVRGYSKRMNIDVVVDNDVIDSIQNALADYRQTTLVWIGSPLFESTMIVGKYSSFKNIIEYFTQSKMSLQIEGNT